MAQLRQDYENFENLDTEVVVIGPENAKPFREYWVKENLPFVGLPDPEHTVSELYGQEVKVLKLGRLPSQMIIDKSGILRFVHYGHSMSDIPSNSELLELLETIESSDAGQFGAKKPKFAKKEKNMTITLPDLPYEKDALAPHISSKTLAFHHGKHHNAYVTNLKKLIEGTDLTSETIEDIIKKTVNDADKAGIFNNAAQVWNHTFYWQSMKPNGGGLPTGDIAEKIDADFEGYDNFIEQLKNAGLTQFGSGWAWLVLNNNKLEIMKTSNADTPIAHGVKPLLTVDVWEHAYYLDYQNGRGNYLDAFINNLINWEFVNSNLV